MFDLFNSDKDSEHRETDQFGGDFADEVDEATYESDLRPRDGEPVRLGRDRESGQFTHSDDEDDPVPLERDRSTGQFGADPMAIGNFGSFNSPYETNDGEKEYKDK